MGIKLLSIVLALVFLASGGAKLAGLAFEIAAFERWGYSLWFMYLIGTIEVAGGIGLLVQRFSALASVNLALVMIGAVVTHINHAEWPMLAVAGSIFILAAVRAWLGRNEIYTLVKVI